MRKSGLPHRTWVVIADGEKALILVNEGDDEDMNLVLHRNEQHDNLQAQERSTDRPGRRDDGAARQRSALQETDWHQLKKERFADDLAEILYKAAHAGRFERLVILASRVVLAELRKTMHGEVKERVMLEVPKVLTNHPLDEVEAIVSRSLREAA